MKVVFFRVSAVLISCAMAVANAQESPYVLNRGRTVSLDADTAWKNCVALVRATPAIVNTIDGTARLVTFTMPLGPADVKDLVLDAKDVEKQALTLHVTIWIEKIAPGARIYVRAAPNGGGFFSHSNGLIEQRILDAIEKGEKWKPLAELTQTTTLNALPPQAEEAAAELAKVSKQIVLNASSTDPSVATISFTIRNAELSQFVSKLGKTYYPGVAHITLWFEPSPSGTVVLARTLIFESGSLSPSPLASNGRLESTLLGAIQKRLAGGAEVPLAIGSDYRGKQDFWNVLFGIGAPGDSSDAVPTLSRELPVPIDQAWAAGLHVVTQSRVIVDSNRSAGTFTFLAAHTSRIGTQYIVHRVVVRFTATDFGTQMSIVIPRAQETKEEGEDDLKLYGEQIGTELFIKDRLKWLIETKETK